ncbi:hypothetical protein LAZ67_2006011 [Cordylochernes scorpioides]|uniref:Transposase n=1 Tax=Cordylochernes scorpioides TaxID=51811 RepID=A0ABY6K530_9ARAC|nr:hypothetical protein LAZ67_2006011 [Cordylochernes scorpioides]
MVHQWRSWFLEGRQNVHDDERSDRPVTAMDNAAVAAVRNVVEADRRITFDEIMIRLPPGIEIGRSSIGTIMSDILNFRKVCARWVPRFLSENHKQQRMEAARAFLEMHRRDGDQLFSCIVTGDESWVHHSTPETKRQSMVWKKPEESAPKKAKVTIYAGKVMAIVLWDCKGALLVDHLPPNTTVNAARYCEVLTKLRAAIKRKRPGLLSRKMLLFHDNARPHAARTTKTLLENFKWEIFTHPSYSPELAPSDFHLFPALKLHLGGKHFANDDEVQAEANHWLRRQDTAWYNSGIKKLLQRYQNRNGQYDDSTHKLYDKANSETASWNRNWTLFDWNNHVRYFEFSQSLRKMGPAFALGNHKQQRMEAARAFLEMHRKDGDQLFSRIVTGDESWVHHSTPETKRQSMVWEKPEESVPKKGEEHA